MSSPLQVCLVLEDFTHVTLEWDDKSEHAKDFIKKLMTESDQRMSAKDALEHPFIKENIGK